MLRFAGSPEYFPITLTLSLGEREQQASDWRVEWFMGYPFAKECFALSDAFCQTRKRMKAEPCAK